jgi:hypothetical protein
MPPSEYRPPSQQAALSPPPPLAPVVMAGGQGGSIYEHILRFSKLEQTGAPVEMRGGCWSACTMITGFVPKERLCFAPAAFLAFHAARTGEADPRLSLAGTWRMYASYPPEIKSWIDNRGGPDKLKVETFWFMHSHDLWAIGYPRCK